MSSAFCKRCGRPRTDEDYQQDDGLCCHCRAGEKHQHENGSYKVKPKPGAGE